MGKKDYAHQALTGVIVIFFVYFLNSFISYCFRLLMAKKLDIIEYGLFYALFSFMSLVYIIRDTGLNHALIRYIPEFLVHKEEGKAKGAILFILFAELLLSVIITVILFIIAPFLANNYFHAPDYVFVIRLFSFVFFLFAFDNLLSALLQSFQRIITMGVILLLRTIALFILTVFLFIAGLKIQAPIFAYLMVSIISSFILVPLILKKIFAIHKIHTTWEGRENWKLLRFAMTVFITGLGGMLLQNIDTIMLTYFKGLEETALYNVAVPSANIILCFSSAITTVSFPLFSELYSSHLKKQIIAALNLIYRYAFLVSIPILALFLVFPEIIISLLFGAKFVSAAPALSILIIGTFSYVITQVNFSFFNASNRQKYCLILLLSASVLNIIGNYLFIPRFGMIGAAVTSVLCLLAIFILSIIIVKRTVDFKIPIKHITKNICAGLVFLFVIYFMKNVLVMRPILEAIIVGTAGLMVYVVLAFLIGLTSIEEIKWFAYKILKRA